VRDSEGQKMSQNRGNVSDLIDGIERDLVTTKRTYGAGTPEKAAKIEKV